jgi:hypothetical protein
MAREGGGGGGAFGWLVLGVIVGIAGTLAVETLASRHATVTEQTPTSAAVAVVTPPAPPPPVETPARPVSSTPASLSTDATTPSHEDVADDAAAAGMTSRSRTGDADSSAATPN